LCALGRTAANPMLTTIRYFRNEYEAHIKEKRCPALVCKSLISFYIDPTKCKACTICHKNCPVDAVIGGDPTRIHVVDQAKCVKCGTCFDVCPPAFRAVTKISGEPVPPPLPEEQRLIKRTRGN
jgi:NADP-reducing hydrogenase subunit HndC